MNFFSRKGYWLEFVEYSKDLNMSIFLEGNDKNKIQRLTDKIISGKFDDNDIDILLSGLRDYSKKDSLFRELAHFHAHPKIRDKGKFKEYFISYGQQVKFIWQYRLHGEKINLYNSFQKYILDLIYYYINKIDKTLLQEKYNIVPHKLKKEINRNIVIDNKNNTVYFKATTPLQLHDIIIYFLKQIGGQKEILTQNVIINDIIYTLKNNDIIFDENEFKKESNKIMYCILLLLHLKTIEIEENSKNEFPYCSILFDKKEKNIHLGLYGIMNSPEGDDIKIAFPLISTDLLLSEFCDENLLNEILNSKKNDEITCLLEFNNFKLRYAPKSKKKIKNAVVFIFRLMENGKGRLEILSLKDSTKHKES
jgi:hypothetical protein